jgi:hypothetical protein
MRHRTPALVMLAPPAGSLADLVAEDPRDATSTLAEVPRVAVREAPLPDPAPVDGPDSGAAPAVQSTLRCPSCDRSPAIVFPLLRAGAGSDVRLVCLDCCPRARESGGRK